MYLHMYVYSSLCMYLYEHLIHAQYAWVRYAERSCRNKTVSPEMALESPGSCPKPHEAQTHHPPPPSPQNKINQTPKPKTLQGQIRLLYADCRARSFTRTPPSDWKDVGGLLRKKLWLVCVCVCYFTY